MYKNDLFQNEKATFHLEGGFCVLEEFQLSRRVVERQAVVGRESVSGNRLAVVAGGVALIFRPAIFGKLSRNATHIFVAVGLCEHRRCGNIGVLAIALNDALEGLCQRGVETIAVDRQELRLRV